MRNATDTFCPTWAKSRAEVTFVKSDLATLARKACGVRGAKAAALIPAAKARVADRVAAHAVHVTECVTCNEKFA